MEEASNPTTGEQATVLRVAALRRDEARDVRIEPAADVRATAAAELGIMAIRKLRFEGRLSPDSRDDWRFDGHLGATVVQPCVVTLAPVTTRIEESVTRRYLASPPPDPEAAETEMPDDDSHEPLGDVIDLWSVVLETLALALPLYPRADDAELGDVQVTEPGKTPLSDEEARPFAALKGLRDRLGDAGEEG